MMHRIAALGFKGISCVFGCKVLSGVSVRTVSNVAQNNCLCDNYNWAVYVISLLLQFFSVYAVNIPTVFYGVFSKATRLQDGRSGLENR